MKLPLFPVGQLVATPAALEDLAQAGVTTQQLMDRHVAGDWGDLGSDDKASNDAALTGEDRILSKYTLPTGKSLYIITEWDRSVTTILRPEDY